MESFLIIAIFWSAFKKKITVIVLYHTVLYCVVYIIIVIPTYTKYAVLCSDDKKSRISWSRVFHTFFRDRNRSKITRLEYFYHLNLFIYWRKTLSLMREKYFYNDHEFIAIDLFNPYAHYYFVNFRMRDWAFFGKY
jgi:hypothetical protein